MNPFFNALNSGYSPEQILGFISKAIPQMTPMINKAKKSGYPAEKIIGFLSKSFETEDRTGLSESERHAVNRRADSERTKSLLKTGAYATAFPLVAGAAQSALTRALPHSLTSLFQNQPADVALNQGSQSPSKPGVVNQNESVMEPTQGPSQAQPISENFSHKPPSVNLEKTPSSITQTIADNQLIKRDPLKSIELIKNIGEEGRIKNLLEGGLAPRDVAGVVRKLTSKDRLQALESLEGGLEGAIEDFAEQSQNTAKEISKDIKNDVSFSKVAESGIDDGSGADFPEVKLEKNQIVGSKHGLGEIKEIRNGKVLIEVDGKKHAVDEEDLIASPIPEKDLDELYDDLIRGIEKKTGEDISRMVSFAGYDPNTNTLAFLPHDGGLYLYQDISPEEKDLLTDVLTTRKTSGSNFIGAWKAGSKSPIGAAMSKLIRDLQLKAGGKGKEYFMKFNTVYSALEPAIKESKEKKKRKKL